MLRSFGATQDKESIKDLTNKTMTKKSAFLPQIATVYKRRNVPDYKKRQIFADLSTN